MRYLRCNDDACGTHQVADDEYLRQLESGSPSWACPKCTGPATLSKRPATLPPVNLTEGELYAALLKLDLSAMMSGPQMAKVALSAHLELLAAHMARYTEANREIIIGVLRGAITDKIHHRDRIKEEMSTPGGYERAMSDAMDKLSKVFGPSR